MLPRRQAHTPVSRSFCRTHRRSPRVRIVVASFGSGRDGAQPQRLLAAVETPALQSGMTNAWLKQQGLLSFRDLWMQAQGYV